MPTVVSRRRLLGLGAALGGAAVLGTTGTPAWASRPVAWPSTVDLPDGFHPWGIGIGTLPYAYFGSLLGGAIYRANLVTGQGSVIYPGVNPGVFDPRYMALGLQLDQRGRLFVGGGWGRVIKVHDALTGDLLRTYEVGTETTAVGHVVVTPQAVYFADSFNARMYALPLSLSGGLPDQAVTIPLTGDWVQAPGGAATQTGLARTPDGRALLVNNVAPDGGGLFRVDPTTGVARRLDLGGVTLPNTSGIALDGCTLYAPQLADVAVLHINQSGTKGTLLGHITDSRFDIPCAAQVYGDRLYVTNGRFNIPPTPTTKYNAVSVPLFTNGRKQ